MGFEVSVVVAFFFITAVLLGTFSFNTLTSSSEIVSEASAQQNEIYSNRLQTDIEIYNIAVSNVTSPYDLTVSLTNTGSSTLQFDEMNVIIDGKLESYEFSGNYSVWTPDESRDLLVTGLSGSGSHRIKVVTEYGIADYGSYTV